MKYTLLGILILIFSACSDGKLGTEPEDMTEELASILAPEPLHNKYADEPGEAPDDNCTRMHNNVIGPLRKVFNDSNHVQLEAARELGFSPIQTDEDILHLSRPTVKVVSNKNFYVDDLSHSYPYLVPEAAQLLHDIGRAFNDSLSARGGGKYRMKVTSLLRTPTTVKRLRRVNRNATEESTHAYGTTFDISYSKFICDDAMATHRTFEDLKNLLAEVLKDMHDQGRCYVKFEYKQSCFHITARPHPLNRLSASPS